MTADELFLLISGAGLGWALCTLFEAFLEARVALRRRKARRGLKAGR